MIANSENENNREQEETPTTNVVEVTTTSFRVYPIRWYQLVIYVLVTLVNGMLPSTFSAIASETASFYSITITQVNALSVVCLFLYAPGTVFATWAFKKFSIRTVMVIGSLMNLGTWIRPFSLITPNKGYAALLIGQLLPSISAPIFFNAVAEFSNLWFAPGQRDLATTICSMANPLGIAFGFLLPSLIVTDASSAGQFTAVLVVEAALATLTAILVMATFQSEPPTPPSHTKDQPSREFIRDFLALIKNYHFLILLFSFSIGLALFNALTALIYQFVRPSGYSSGDAGVFGALFILVGLVGAGLAGVLMDRTHYYITILKVLIVGACCSIIYFIVILRPSMVYALGFSFAMMGFFLLPLLPVVFECAVECTYPVNATWSIGLLLCTGNVLGGVFILGVDDLLQKAPTYTPGVVFTAASTFIFCMMIISALPLLFYFGPYLRLRSEVTYVIEPSKNACHENQRAFCNLSKNDRKITIFHIMLKD